MGPGLSPSNRGGRDTSSDTTLGQGTVLEPVYLLGQARPIPIEAMKINQSLHPTAACRLVTHWFRASWPLRASFVVRRYRAPQTNNTMKPYRDIHGDSGVSAYEYGDDWIRVQFKHGHTYEYRASRIGLLHLSTMKRLADSGSGLSTYISTNSDVKNGYSDKW
jgi:hypothetical protein